MWERKRKDLFFFVCIRSYIYCKRIRDTSVAFCDFRNVHHFVGLCYHSNHNPLYYGDKRNFLSSVF